MIGHADAAGLSPRLTPFLRCPVDGSPLVMEALAEGQALLVGAALAYPVLLGIPRLVDDPLRRQLVALLRAGQHDAAERVVLRWPTFALMPRLRRRVAREATALAPESVWLGVALSHLADGGAIRQPQSSFTELVRRHSTGLYPDWFAYRFSARTFLPIVGLAGLLPHGAPILEIGTGCGHSTFLLARRAGPGAIVAVDHAFAQLYAARRFMAPEALYVCADVERGLPLAPGAFAAVVMSDTLHFVHAKQRLAQELERVTRPEAMMVLAQIHNGLFPEPFAGEPLPPDGYMGLFEGWSPRLIRNDRLIGSMATADGFDLADPALSDNLAAQRSLSLVGWRGGQGPSTSGGIAQAIAARHTRLIVNPALVQQGGRLVPREGIHPVVAGIIAAADLGGMEAMPGDLAALPAAAAADLLRRLVLLDVPERFI